MFLLPYTGTQQSKKQDSSPNFQFCCPLRKFRYYRPLCKDIRYLCKDRYDTVLTYLSSTTVGNQSEAACRTINSFHSQCECSLSGHGKQQEKKIESCVNAGSAQAEKKQAFFHTIVFLVVRLYYNRHFIQSWPQLEIEVILFQTHHGLAGLEWIFCRLLTLLRCISSLSWVMVWIPGLKCALSIHDGLWRLVLYMHSIHSAQMGHSEHMHLC